MPTSTEVRPLSALVVDDKADTADTMAVLLSLHGCEVRTACDGADALASAAADPPDLVLTDIGMPRRDGWAFVRQLRAQPGGAKPFVVIVSGYGREEDKRRSAEAGADLHLLKPVPPAELTALLERVRQPPPLRCQSPKGFPDRGAPEGG